MLRGILRTLMLSDWRSSESWWSSTRERLVSRFLGVLGNEFSENPKEMKRRLRLNGTSGLEGDCQERTKHGIE